MARLRRSQPGGPGFGRVKSGKGFRYTGDPSAVDRDRIDALVIPPAWTDVWISPHENGHIQATGVDAAGRTQYLYHERWRRQKDTLKFRRMLQLAEALPGARGTVTRDLRGDDQHRQVLAAAFRMLDAGALRIGSERYADDNGSHGLSTLLCSHVAVQGDVITLGFPAKSGKTWSSRLSDGDLAPLLKRLAKRGPTARLLAWEDEDGEWHPLAASEINDYVRERTGGAFTAKDFRTLRGTAAAAVSLAKHGPATTRTAVRRALAQAMRDASVVLGNTPTIAKASYVDPRVVALFKKGRTVDAQRSGSIESELRALLD